MPRWACCMSTHVGLPPVRVAISSRPAVSVVPCNPSLVLSPASAGLWPVSGSLGRCLGLSGSASANRFFLAGPLRDVNRDSRSDVRNSDSGHCTPVFYEPASRSRPLRCARKTADRDPLDVEQVSVPSAPSALHHKVNQGQQVQP